MTKEKSTLDDKIHWYKDAIIYELHIKAFKDSNGDGIGDFKGLIQKLDYLQDLGVTAIWLLPFYPSPLKDDGYDIADYYSINPSYGNMSQFREFMREAHNRGLKVITELVLNHTSDQHAWFQRARTAKKGSSYRDYYVWSDDPNKYNETRIIFKDFEASNWTWDPVAKQYFWHRFYSHQPDLNFDNPKVQQEVFKVLDFWLSMGVDGFRLDAVPYLFERENTNCENLPETHEFLKKLRAHVDSKFPNKLLLAEANMWPEDSAAYFGKGDECHMNYHFPIMPRMFMSVQMEDRYPITDIFDQTPAIPNTCQWAMFLRNHDELTLEMVTDEERDYMYKVYTKDPLARINLGIRHRLAPLLNNNRKKIELMNYLLFSLPGTPVIYYGDEIGMGDNYYLGDRDGVRTPMQWSADRNAGFSGANPQQLYLPVILDPEYQYEAVNVENQQKNNSSLLWWMKRVITMRKRYKSFSRGDIEFLTPDNPKVLAFKRTYEDETILVLANLSRFSQAAELDLKDCAGQIPVELFSQNKFPAIKKDPYLFTLGPHGYYWFLLKHDNSLKQIKKPDTTLEIKNWDSIISERVANNLMNNVVPDYIKKCRWFGGKNRVIQQISVVESAIFPIKDEYAAWFIVEVYYNEGLPEIYQLPVCFSDENEKKLLEKYPKSIITTIKVGDKKGILYDAVYSEKFRKELFTLMAKRKKIKLDKSDFVFYANKKVEKVLNEKKEKLSSKVLNVEQSNTSFTYEGQFFVKIYRKLEPTVNPDMEITRFLTEKTDFNYVPGFLGALECRTKSGNMILGMMQEMVPNQGDAWQYMLDSIKGYYERVLESDFPEPQESNSGTLAEPVGFNEMPGDLQKMIGGPYVERVNLLGLRTAEMHLALASRPEEKDFEPEAFSLHYQRSLFSSLQSLVRSTFQSLEKFIKTAPPEVKEEALEILAMKNDILKCFQKIFAKKITTMKIRVHGDYHLGQVLFTGKDFVIIDFEGEPARSYSERRIKRCPLRDVAGMMRSFHYAAYSTLFQNGVRVEDTSKLEAWVEPWYHYVSGFYVKSYMEKVKGSDFIPTDKQSLEILLQTFLLEKSVYELNYELNNRPDWVVIPMRGIKYIMRRCVNV